MKLFLQVHATHLLVAIFEVRKLLKKFVNALTGRRCTSMPCNGVSVVLSATNVNQLEITELYCNRSKQVFHSRELESTSWVHCQIRNGNKYIIVVSDYFINWQEAFPFSDQTASNVARVLIREIVLR